MSIVLDIAKGFPGGGEDNNNNNNNNNDSEELQHVKENMKKIVPVVKTALMHHRSSNFAAWEASNDQLQQLIVEMKKKSLQPVNLEGVVGLQNAVTMVQKALTGLCQAAINK